MEVLGRVILLVKKIRRYGDILELTVLTCYPTDGCQIPFNTLQVAHEDN